MNILFSVMAWLACSRNALSNGQRGATLIEYVLIVAVIAIAVFGVGAAFDLDEKIAGVFTDASTAIGD